jgi:uncharacterized protein YndB with AHSA1/START domain
MSGKIARSVAMDCRTGGRITEIDHAGNPVIWGSVTAFEPPQKLSLAWHINCPESEATWVDIAFEAAGNGTRVTLTHHGWEAFGDNAQKMRDGYNSGWTGVFETAFAAACQV